MPKIYETLLISSSGDELLATTQVRPSLDLMQQWVGGFIEHTKVKFKGKTLSMVCNEEGMLENQPINQKATEYFQLAHEKGNALMGWTPQNIHGSVAIALNWRL